MFDCEKCFWSTHSYQLNWKSFSVFDLFTCVFILCWFYLNQLNFFLRMPCATRISVLLILRNSVYHFCFVHSLFHWRNQLVWFHLIYAFYKCVTDLSLCFLQPVYILIALALLIVLVICQILKLNLVAYNSSSFFLNPHLFSSFKL